MRAIGRSIAAIWRWMGGPWRSLKAFCVALINLDRRQMRALFSIAMLGGIISLSFQNIAMIYQVKILLGQAAGTLFGQMVLGQQLWNNIIILVFCVSLALIVWGADYFTAKYKGVELSAGSGGKPVDPIEPPAEPAKRAAGEPIPADIDSSGRIRPDDEMV